MLKKDIKAIFQTIRSGAADEVKALIAKKPELIYARNFAPPKKDDGQSVLQVAFKTGRFAIARFLVEQGAEVNFMEESPINEWRAPVLHDCIRAAVFNSYTLQKDGARFQEGLGLLQLLLASGANTNATDSYGNTCLARAILDSRQMIDHPNSELSNGILLTQLRAVFQLLQAAGADPTTANPPHISAVQSIKLFRLEEYRLLEG